LTGENGETLLVEYLATLKMQDKQYAVMRSCDDNEDSEDSEEVIIMKIENDGEEDYLISIDDEENSIWSSRLLRKPRRKILTLNRQSVIVRFFRITVINY